MNADIAGIVPTVVTTVAELRARVRAERSQGARIGLVPTMGALHAGHARLIEAARDACDFVVVSIFVNPTQFGPNEDYARYPRTPDDDLRVCGAAGARLAFMPSDTEVYPRGEPWTRVEVPRLADTLCGRSRPGHFRGVAIVVAKLLNMAAPDVAFFGEKDYQQLLIVRRMAADLDLPVEIRGVPTVREPDGLALSSRNRYLNTEQRRAATALWRALEAARAATAAGERDADRVRQILRTTLELEPLVRTEYAEVADAETLAPLEHLAGNARALVAAQVGPARLIDNAALPAAAPRPNGREADGCS